MLHLPNRYGTTLIMALGLCLYIIHMQHSNIAGFGLYISWAIDSYSHLEYIARVADTRAVPAPGACWECHQPPLYYLLAALPYSIAKDFHLLSADVEVHVPPVLLGSVPTSPVLAVRVLSLCFYMVFAFFGARLLAMEVRWRPVYYIGLCLLVFWPYGVTKAAMISNDVPLYMAQAAALYYILRWRRDEAAGSLALAMLWNGIAFAFKYTGITVTPFIGLVVLLKCYENRRLAWQLLAKPVLLSLCVGLVLAGGTFARTYYHYRIATHSSVPLLVPSGPVVVRLMPVPNDRLEYFALPDFGGYMQSPFLGESRHPSSEMSYFMNFVLKSSLFGIPHWTPIRTARALTVLLCGMLVYMACSLPYLALKDRAAALDVLPFVVFVALQLAALITYRVLYPHTGNQDFRFIYPTTIAMTVLYSKVLSWHRTHSYSHIFWLGALLAGGFSCTSIAFILVNSRG